MTERPEIDPALVEAGARAMLAACNGECIEAPPGGLCDDSNCQCRKEARAVLEAILPMVREMDRLAQEQAGERARAIIDEIYRETGGPTEKLRQAFDAYRQTIRNPTTGE